MTTDTPRSFAASSILLIGATLVLAGCGRAARRFHYNLAPPPVAARAALDATLSVQAFQVARPYVEERIAYRRSPVEFEYYQSHRWGAPPAELVRDAMIRGLRESGLFRGVWEYGGLLRSDYVIGGRLERLEEVDVDAGHWEAHLRLDVYVTRQDSKDLVLFRHFDLRTPAREPRPAAVAEAMSTLVGEVIEALVEDLVEDPGEAP